MRRHLRSVLMYVFFVVFGLVSSSNAVVLDTSLDRHWVKEAQLIVVGEIVDISYASSIKEAEEDVELPHSFVTIAIEDVLKGSAQDGKSITLRFQGGMAKDERYLEIMGIPRFDVGDRGVFFIHKNGSHICPLVGWKQGFVRIIDGQLFTDMGNRLILADDPVRAGRIHPKDIRNFETFRARMIKAQTEFDRFLAELLSRETLLLLESSQNITDVDPTRLNYLPPSDISEEAYELKNVLLPFEFRQIPRSFGEAMLIRDLNWLLTRREFAQKVNFSQLKLSDDLLRQIEIISQLPLPDVILLNRRILEAAYPELLTKSVDQVIVRGEWQMIEEIMTQTRGDNVLSMRMVTPTEQEGPNPKPEPMVEGKTLEPDAFLEHIKVMIEALHTPEELRLLEPVRSLSPTEPFFVRNPLPPLAVSTDLILPDKDEPVGEIDRLEVELLRESGGNPVVKTQ